jgi:hypothetical protein
MSDKWSDEQREAVNRWQNKDSSERHPHDLLPNGSQGYDRGVSEEECASMRELFKQQPENTVKSMVGSEFDYSETTIGEHVFDRCNHEIAESPADSPMGTIDPDDFVTDQECATMRSYYFSDGDEEITNVEARFDKSYGQVYHHLVGRCTCDHDESDIRSVE